MARGKIQIKKIENQTNRQVTYSKRRNGLFKKANELTVLCDAKVSILMLSTTLKIHEYISPSTSTKQMVDQYQQALGVDVWNSHYEKMQEQLRTLKEVNRNLRRDISQRMGESLNDLSYYELSNLMEEVNESLKAIRERKYTVIMRKIETHRRKLRNCEELHTNLLLEMDARQEDSHFGLVDNEGDYHRSVIGFSNGGGPRILALRLQSNHLSLHRGSAGSGFTFPLFD
uniref:MADS box protein n=1 Tax=Gentiana scabra TaxID=292393 RepID=A0A0K2QQ42_9GENT|nr:MADS box protein [Gentiana scabra]